MTSMARRLLPLLLAGAGKSTQADFLNKRYGFVVISAEQLTEADPALLGRSKQPEIHGADIHYIDGTARAGAISKAIAALVDARLKPAPKGTAQ